MKRWLVILVVLVGVKPLARAQFAVYGMGSAGRLSGFNSIYATSGSNSGPLTPQATSGRTAGRRESTTTSSNLAR